MATLEIKLESIVKKHPFTIEHFRKPKVIANLLYLYVLLKESFNLLTEKIKIQKNVIKSLKTTKLNHRYNELSTLNILLT